MQTFGESVTCSVDGDASQDGQFRASYCTAQDTASIRPSLFEERSKFDPRLVQFPPSDPWIAEFAYNGYYEPSQGIKAIYNGDPVNISAVDALRKTIIVYQSAYMYWPWLFLVSGGLSYLIMALWKSKENGLIAAATQGLEGIYESPDDLEKAVFQLRHHLGEPEPRHLRSYVKWYWVCEVFALLNQVGQACFFNWMLNGELLLYGWNFFVFLYEHYSGRDTMNPLFLLFPRTANCEWWKYGLYAF